MLDRIEAQLGHVLMACWCGPSRYGVPGLAESDEPVLFAVFQAPLERVFSLKQPAMSGGAVFTAVELGQFCSSLAKGSVKAIEVMSLKQGSAAIVFEDSVVWNQLRKLAEPSKLLTAPAIDAIFEAVEGRSGLKGLKQE